MTKQGRLNIIREAIQVQGYLPVPAAGGREYRIRAITGTAPNGAWITDHPTTDYATLAEECEAEDLADEMDDAGDEPEEE